MVAPTHQIQDGVSGLYADQFFEPPLALDQRQVAQTVAVKFGSKAFFFFFFFFFFCAARNAPSAGSNQTDFMKPQRAGRWPDHL